MIVEYNFKNDSNIEILFYTIFRTTFGVPKVEYVLRK